MKISIIPLTLIILLSLTVHTTLQGQKRSTESRMSMLSQKIVSAVDIEEKNRWSKSTCYDGRISSST